MRGGIRRYLIAGLLTWLPVAITLWVLLWLLGITDSMFGWLLDGVQALVPSSSTAITKLRHVPGLSVLVLALVLLVTGVFVANVFGQWWIAQWDRLLYRIPIVKSIYSSVKQVSDTLFSSSGNAFREAVLVRYPHQDSWTVAFVTGRPSGQVASHLDAVDNDEWLSVYVPTTPNPTSGFFLLMRRRETRPLAMSVDQALKYVISMGVVMPGADAARASRVDLGDTPRLEAAAPVPASTAAPDSPRNPIG